MKNKIYDKSIFIEIYNETPGKEFDGKSYEFPTITLKATMIVNGNSYEALGSGEYGDAISRAEAIEKAQIEALIKVKELVSEDYDMKGGEQ